jgi:hypothetical protein
MINTDQKTTIYFLSSENEIDYKQKTKFLIINFPNIKWAFIDDPKYRNFRYSLQSNHFNIILAEITNENTNLGSKIGEAFKYTCDRDIDIEKKSISIILISKNSENPLFAYRSDFIEYKQIDDLKDSLSFLNNY